jgi:CBS domain-containing protein
MKIKDVLQRKGNLVATVLSELTVSGAVEELGKHDVGALVVVDEASEIAGIISERDIVRQLREQGADLLQATVGDIMTRLIATCTPDDDVELAMRVMTERHVRHLPVMKASALVGIVSIGDLVKNRIDELETTTDALASYISGG